MVDTGHKHSEPQQPDGIMPHHGYGARYDFDFLDDEQFHETSDRLLRLLSTSTNGTWGTMSGRAVNEGDRGETALEVFVHTMQSLCLTALGIDILHELMGSPTYTQSYFHDYDLGREGIASLATYWAFDVKPHHFAAVWRVFADLRDGKIDHATAMADTAATRESICELITRWSNTHDMLNTDGTIDWRIAWGRIHGSEVKPPDGGSRNPDAYAKIHYCSELIMEFTDLYPGAADLPEVDPTAELGYRIPQPRYSLERRNRATANPARDDRDDDGSDNAVRVRKPHKLTGNQRAVLDLLSNDSDGHTLTEISRSTGIKYGTASVIARRLLALGLVERSGATRHGTYILAK